MEVVSLLPLTKGRFKICLDNGTDFVLYKAECDRYKVHENASITIEKYNEIFDEIIVPRCRKRAMHLIEKQDRSEKNIREKLEEGFYPERAIDSAIEFLYEYGYIDDARMASNHIHFYQDSRSRQRIKQDLLSKGIPMDIIERCLEEEYTSDTLEQINKLIQKKGYDTENATYEDRGKMYRFLASRGYSVDEINRALRP